MNKLQLIDAVKLNEMFEYLKNDHENKKLLQGIHKQDEFQLEEKKEAMENAVKQNKHVGESMVSFLKQKNALKRKADNLIGDDAKQKEEKNEKKPEENLETKTSAEKKLIEFLNKKGLKNHTLRMGGRNINRADLIYDLSHNASKQFMLNVNERKIALKYLKIKKNMPANIIKNNALRQHYTSKQYDSEGETSSGGATSSAADDSLFLDTLFIPEKKTTKYNLDENREFVLARQKARGRKRSE